MTDLFQAASGFSSISDLKGVPSVGQSILDLHRGRLTCIVVFQAVSGFSSISDLKGVPSVGQSILDLHRGRLICIQSKRANR